MSLTQQVADMVLERGSGDADELTQLLPGYTYKQVLNALKHARQQGLIHCNTRQPRRGKGVLTGSLPARHYPGPKPGISRRPVTRASRRKIQPVASVWDLACEPRLGPWPPRFEGGREYLLGE